MNYRTFRSLGLITPVCLLLAAVALVAAPSARADDEKPKDKLHEREEQEEKQAAKKVDAKSSAKKQTERSADDKQKSADKKSGKKESQKDADDNGKDKKDDEPKLSVTHHKATIDGKEISFTATAGKMVMKTDEGDPKARVFFTAYSKDDVKNLGDRPITFCFNGGPGSSSVWLHIGMLGPRRVKLAEKPEPLRPPHRLINNSYSLLDVTDLVFIDPVGTGFSRPEKGEDRKQFHGYDEDIRSVGLFIHNYISKYGRWRSPKFLIGESYGGLRAAGLSGELQDRYHLYLNGIVLVSAVVDFQTLMAYGNNDIAYALFLPSYTATAWYHDSLSRELQRKDLDEVVDEAEEFALGPYLRALAAGDSLSRDRREEVVRRIARLTGLSEEYVDRANLRIPMQRFGQELLRDRGKIVGRFDSRYTGLANDRVSERAEHDPSAAAVFGTFTSAMNDYLRTRLKVDEEQVYEILSDKVWPWDYSEFTNRFVDASETLRQAMTENPFLKVFAACGYYDLATPSFAMEYTRNHLMLARELRDNFTMGFYEAGHMMYAHEPSLKKLREDLLKFYEETLSAELPAAESDDQSTDEDN